MRKFALEIVVENSSKKWVFIAHKNSARWQPGKVRNDLSVDRLVDRPTVIFMTVVAPVDRPADQTWIQRAAALCRSTSRSNGARTRELCQPTRSTGPPA